jgi:hypothetical protein
MIGKISVGKSAYGLLRYCLGDKKELSEQDKISLSEREGVQHKDRAEVLHYNLCGGNVRELNSAFREVEVLSKRVEKPVFHISLRPSGADKLAKNQWADIAEACAKEFGFDDHQYLVILHKDAKEQHIHIVANRVGFDGKAISTSNNYARMAAFCRRIEKQYSLTEVPGTRKPLSINIREPMQNSREEKLRTDIKKVLIRSRNYADFERQITAMGYQVIKGRGISFIDDKKVKIKGSDVGFSLATIEKLLQKNNERLSSTPDSTTQKFSPDERTPALGGHNSIHSGSHQEQGLVEQLWEILLSSEQEYIAPNPFKIAARKKKKKKGITT